MRLLLVRPQGDATGNDVTSRRWQHILSELGHEVDLASSYDGAPCDALIALHGFHSHPSIRAFSDARPHDPVVVALGGTDVYGDFRDSPEMQDSLERATRIVALQPRGLTALPPRVWHKTRVIYQSAEPCVVERSPRDGFRVCVVTHLREVKDPLRAAHAARLLPARSRIEILMVGRALDPAWERLAREEVQQNPRVRWIEGVGHDEARRLIGDADLVAITSRLEGSCNVLCEALASSVPVVSTRIAGIQGTLGDDYPGYFEVGDTEALAALLSRAEEDHSFLAALREHCARAAALVRPEAERAAWRALLAELG